MQMEGGGKDKMLVLDVNDIDMEFADSEGKDMVADIEDHHNSDNSSERKRKANILIANDKYGGAVYFDEDENESPTKIN